jgi:hypothetical protein
MINIPQTETTKNLIEIAMKETIKFTENGETIAYLMTPDALEDYVDAFMAIEAEKNGFASDEEVKRVMGNNE